LIKRGVSDETAQHLAVKADRARFFIGDAAACLTLQPLQLVLVGGAVILAGDVDRADLRELATAKAAENVADAPDREADGDQAKNHAHDSSAQPIAGSLANTAKHRSPNRLGS